MSILGEQLKEYRAKADLTRQELSNLTGISVQTILSIENGKIADPKYFTVQALYKGLGVRVYLRQKKFDKLEQIKFYLRSKKMM